MFLRAGAPKWSITRRAASASHLTLTPKLDTKAENPKISQLTESRAPFNPEKQSFQDDSDIDLQRLIRKIYFGVSPHIHQNPFGHARAPWVRSHMQKEWTLFEILRNVENYGIGRCVQFQLDIDPYSPINLVNRENTKWIQQEMEITGEYATDHRSSQSDETALKSLNRANSTFWKISRVFPDYNAPGIEYGIATGFLTINGLKIPGERLITHALKPGWVLVPKIYQPDLISQSPLDSASKSSRTAAKKPAVRPEVLVKQMYRKLPPLVRAQTVERLAKQQAGPVDKVPMMRSLARRGTLDNLNTVTVLENLHDPERQRFV